ncbi:MAG: lipopolysaccharide biosynthesis protein [Fibrobacterales bacterium]
MLKNFIWSAVEKVSIQVVSFVLSVILARILDPSDYGIIGMITIFIALSQIMVNGGISHALIQKQDCTDTDYSTSFYFNVTMSVALYCILYFAAPLVADFYNKPELISILRVMCITFVLNSLTVVHLAKLNLVMDFKSLAKVNLIGTVVSGSAGIYMAYTGFGVWALVYQNVLRSTIVVITLSLMIKWIPRHAFSIESFKRLFTFGSKLVIAGIYGTIYSNIYMVVIGKYYKIEDVGYFTRARQFVDIPSGLMSNIARSVSFPLLSSLQNDKSKLLEVNRKVTSVMAFCTIPAMTLFALLAKPLIIVVLTEKWLPIVPLLQWLCFSRMITPINELNMSTLNSLGKPGLFLKVDLLMAPVLILSMIITFPIGLNAIAIGIVCTSWIAFFVNSYFPGKLIGYGALKQLYDFRKTFISTLIMAFSVYQGMLLVSNNYLQILVGTVVAVVSFLIPSYLFKSPEIEIIMNKFSRKKPI